MYLREVRCMTYAENVLTAYQSRAASDNWAGWAIANPTLETILNEAEMLYAKETADE